MIYFFLLPAFFDFLALFFTGFFVGPEAGRGVKAIIGLAAETVTGAADSSALSI